MIQIKDNKVISTDGKTIHIISTDTFGKSFFPARYPIEKYEEVDEIPNIRNEEDYGNQVNDLIRRRYSLSEELGILRQKDEKPEEYRVYFAFCEECKAKAREWLKEHPNGDLPPLPQVEEVTDYLSETTDDVVGFGQ